ncbi:1-acyl-sn-glycerol-3-phosphate acyltransferase [Deinococcus lacus]|uniref:1-acyl-sn-glycerol-3-phosphate acyltransferase n=1 Tax=Deinococcus lacus TaxID=392561 RepID=A0ABW1YFH5_9DEIO
MVAVAAPHTHNSDFWPGIFWSWATRTPVHWVAKHSLFRPPLGWLMRAWGGLPVNRSRAGGNFVDGVVNLIKESDELMLVVAPEGTRERTEHWKTGFYYMALKAQVPVAVIVVDWTPGRRRIGPVGYVTLSGDMEADFGEIRALLQGAQGRVPENFGPVVPPPACALGQPAVLLEA